MAQPALAEQETAVRQVTRFGYVPSDVRHILVTHRDVDHCGGLPDFPEGHVHVIAAELHVAHAESPSFRHRAAHWAHEPRRVTMKDGWASLPYNRKDCHRSSNWPPGRSHPQATPPSPCTPATDGSLTAATPTTTTAKSRTRRNRTH
ncbi:MBL fold metallo-hydrolase [Streptomyces sp. NBC_00028]|uniref:MBL fold metallo-hydrolase n=1 Tax=Streptomyces sp. NBC_00028 TaxID=2975624 RepID=UPI0038637B3D